MKQAVGIRKDRMVKLKCRKCGHTFCTTLISEEKPFCPKCCNSSDFEFLDEVSYKVG